MDITGFLQSWHFNWIEILCGAIGGFINFVWRNQNITFPEKEGNLVRLNFLVPVLLGGFVAFVVNTHPVLSALMGFSANDFLKATADLLSKKFQTNQTENQQN